MARYRSRDEVDMRWNRIRRRITRELDLQIADWREETLNELLTSAWDQYKTALSTGDVLELEPRYESFVATALGDVIDLKPDDAKAA